MVTQPIPTHIVDRGPKPAKGHSIWGGSYRAGLGVLESNRALGTSKIVRPFVYLYLLLLLAESSEHLGIVSDSEARDSLFSYLVTLIFKCWSWTEYLYDVLSVRRTSVSVFSHIRLSVSLQQGSLQFT